MRELARLRPVSARISFRARGSITPGRSRLASHSDSLPRMAFTEIAVRGVVKARRGGRGGADRPSGRPGWGRIGGLKGDPWVECASPGGARGGVTEEGRCLDP